MSMERQPHNRNPSAVAVHAKAERRLFCVPIIHTAADMGGLAPAIGRLAVRKVGRQARSRSDRLIARMWVKICTAVEAWALPWERVRLYQDSLPVCGREEAIVRDLASVGSANHQLLLSLMDKGATLMGTESPELLLEEYHLALTILSAKTPEEVTTIDARHQAHSRALVVRRDQFIAKRINESLRAGETGLLFLGLLHSIEPGLRKDIRLTYPLNTLRGWPGGTP